MPCGSAWRLLSARPAIPLALTPDFSDSLARLAATAGADSGDALPLVSAARDHGQELFGGPVRPYDQPDLAKPAPPRPSQAPHHCISLCAMHLHPLTQLSQPAHTPHASHGGSGWVDGAGGLGRPRSASTGLGRPGSERRCRVPCVCERPHTSRRLMKAGHLLSAP